MSPQSASRSLFEVKKAKILQLLALPDEQYSDASPKGSVDVGIRELINEVNELNGFVTTSSCAGRVSVFLEGRKTAAEDAPGQVASVGGKGAGGKWLFVSHDILINGGVDWAVKFGLFTHESVTEMEESSERRLIHFKFEPMILHILTASAYHAQLIVNCGLQAGFRESGILNILDKGPDETATPVVALRSMGLGFESLVGVETNGRRQMLVTPEYLQILIDVSQERFAENTKRIDRFRRGLLKAVKPPVQKLNAEGGVWEDAAARKERMRAEGLRRKLEKQEAKETEGTMENQDDKLYLGAIS